MKRFFVILLCALLLASNLAFLALPALSADVSEVHLQGTMKNKSTSRSAELDLYFDTDWFFDTQKQYNPRLSTLSCIVSLLSYEDENNKLHISTENGAKASLDYKNPFTFFADLGFEQVRFFDENQKYYIGYRKIEKDGEKKTLVAVVARGTDSKDIGEIASDANVLTKNDNHKGFEDATLSLVEDLDGYLKDFRIDKKKAVYWVTGHSRGGAVANILSAKLKAEGGTCFAYTFASPNLTNLKKADSDAFNLINTDDWVTTSTNVAFKKRYGKDMSLSYKEAFYNKSKKLLKCDNIESDIPYDADAKGMLAHHNLFFYYAHTIYLENKTVVVWPKNIAKTFGEEDPTLEYDIECRGKTASDFFTGSLSRKSGENVGEYEITAGNLDYSTGEYDSPYTLIVKSGATLTVNKARLPEVAPISCSYLYSKGSEGSVSLDLSQYIPGDAGKYTCTVETSGDSIFKDAPYCLNKTLNYNVAAAETFDSQTAEVKVLVTMQNYEDLTLTLKLALFDEKHEETASDTEKEEKEKTDKKSSALPIVLGSLGGAAVLCGGGAFAYFYLKKKRK